MSTRLNTYQFTQNLMGKVVTVKRIAEVVYDKTSQRRIEFCSLTPPRAGWVTGVRWMREGKIWNESYDPLTEGPVLYDRYLEISRTIPVILVTFWPTLNPTRVPLEDGWEVGGTPYPPGREEG